MGDEVKPQHGDEAQLFEQFNDELTRWVSAAVRTTPEVVDDACAHAWAQFLARQPAREREWKRWMFRTAQREAWRLNRQRYEALAIDPVAAPTHRGAVVDPVDQRDRQSERLALDAATQILAELPPRLRRIAFLRATGLKYREIGEITGDSPTRINQLVTRANLRIHELLAHIRDVDRELPPRVRRLQELEESPPLWLRTELGQPPQTRDTRVPSAERLLLWRRAALAISDYRAVASFSDRERGLGSRPSDPSARRAYDLAQHAIDEFQVKRRFGRELG